MSAMHINVKVFQSFYIWFHLKDINLSQIIGNHTDANKVTYSADFDYEKISASQLRVYIDMQIQTQQADMKYRCGFQFKLTNPGWDEIFVTDALYPLVTSAIDQSCTCYNTLCDQNQISAPVLKFDDQVASKITESFIYTYYTYRKPEETLNEYLINNTGLTWSKGKNTIILLQCTFIILDAFLYDYQGFDTIHNREEFEKVLPFTKYLTLKFNCREIENKKVKLSFLNAILFLQCVDCALKLLLGNKEDILIPPIEAKGMDEEIRTIYIVEGGKFIKQMNESFKNSGARIINLEKFYDWDALFR
jgi:hypothetical protein